MLFSKKEKNKSVDGTAEKKTKTNPILRQLFETVMGRNGTPSDIDGTNPNLSIDNPLADSAPKKTPVSFFSILRKVILGFVISIGIIIPFFLILGGIINVGSAFFEYTSLESYTAWDCFVFLMMHTLPDAIYGTLLIVFWSILVLGIGTLFLFIYVTVYRKVDSYLYEKEKKELIANYNEISKKLAFLDKRDDAMRDKLKEEASEHLAKSVRFVGKYYPGGAPKEVLKNFGIEQPKSQSQGAVDALKDAKTHS